MTKHQYPSADVLRRRRLGYRALSVVLGCALMVVCSAGGNAAERSPASVIAADALRTAAAEDRVYAAQLRQLALGLEAGTIQLEQAKAVVAIIAGLRSGVSGGPSHGAAIASGGLSTAVQATEAGPAPTDSVQIQGGASAVTAVLDGMAPPAPVAVSQSKVAASNVPASSRPVAEEVVPGQSTVVQATAGQASQTEAAVVSPLDAELASVLSEPMPKTETEVDATPPTTTVITYRRNENGTELVMLAAYQAEKGQELMVRRDGKDVVEVMVLRVESDHVLGMVFGATWNVEDNQRQLREGDELWLVSGE